MFKFYVRPHQFSARPHQFSAGNMKIAKPYCWLALVAIAVVTLAGIRGVGAEPGPDESATKPPSVGAQEETTRYVPIWAKWQRDVVQFNAMLQKLVETADIPEEEEFKKRLESESGWVEVITDGYGGVVDFNAAKGTIQYEANNLMGPGGPHIDWEFELTGDTKIYWNKSTNLTPKITRTLKDGKEDSQQPIFGISIAKASAGPFRAGDRVRLKASIDDFSRFKKDYGRATGLVAIYYLEDSPNPVFTLRLDEAEITLLKPSTSEQDGADQPTTAPKSKPEGNENPTPESKERPQ